MEYGELRKQLEDMAEDKYRDFSQALIPGGRPMLGVRIPALRKLAKEIAKDDWQGYLDRAQGLDDKLDKKDAMETDTPELSEIVNLQGFVIGYAKADYETLLPYIARHVEKIDDWYLCDGFCAGLKIVKKHREEFLEFLMPYIYSQEEFERRFGAVMLMDYYLDDTYIHRTLELLDSMEMEGYYCQMAIAWAVATAWAKQRDITHQYLTGGQHHLTEPVLDMTIRKLLDSYRVSPEDKVAIREMKRVLHRK
ncbi:MAG: DNA alkylation repair protein [Lachnospiraceae bacterium]|nr:DNA alkylation repair protein [Lachnospiraceae bacterium]